MKKCEKCAGKLVLDTVFNIMYCESCGSEYIPEVKATNRIDLVTKINENLKETLMKEKNMYNEYSKVIYVPVYEFDYLTKSSTEIDVTNKLERLYLCGLDELCKLDLDSIINYDEKNIETYQEGQREDLKTPNVSVEFLLNEGRKHVGEAKLISKKVIYFPILFKFDKLIKKYTVYNLNNGLSSTLDIEKIEEKGISQMELVVKIVLCSLTLIFLGMILSKNSIFPTISLGLFLVLSSISFFEINERKYKTIKEKNIKFRR